MGSSLLEKQPVFEPIASKKLGLLDEADAVRIKARIVPRISARKLVVAMRLQR